MIDGHKNILKNFGFTLKENTSFQRNHGFFFFSVYIPFAVFIFSSRFDAGHVFRNGRFSGCAQIFLENQKGKLLYYFGLDTLKYPVVPSFFSKLPGSGWQNKEGGIIFLLHK